LTAVKRILNQFIAASITGCSKSIRCSGVSGRTVVMKPRSWFSSQVAECLTKQLHSID